VGENYSIWCHRAVMFNYLGGGPSALVRYGASEGEFNFNIIAYACLKSKI